MAATTGSMELIGGSRLQRRIAHADFSPSGDIDVNPDWRDNIDLLVSRLGLVSEVTPYAFRGLPDLNNCIADGGTVLPGNQLSRARPVQGIGRALGSRKSARAIAVAEAAERYAGSEFLNQPMLTSNAESVPGLTIDLSSVPRCSEEEYNQPGCPLSPPDWQLPMRWVQGVDLYSNRKCFLPAVMALWGMKPLPSENFWYQISTGYAVHTSITSALFRAASEVVERDAIAITWMQQLPLPVLAETVQDTETRALVGWAERHFMKLHLYDATTDVSLPTAYALLRAPYDRRIATTVACATGLTLRSAAWKAALDAVATKLGLSSSTSAPPATISEIAQIEDGALFMGRPEMQPAFNFLTNDNDGRKISDKNVVFACNEQQGLRRLVGILGGAAMEVIAVNRTTRELASAGLVAVVVIVPKLQPMSLNPLAQLRAHPRLYSAPAKMHFRVLAEHELNPFPQPFA
jgi:ribosomal protein S12 methylthiotransferase accessory factor